MKETEDKGSVLVVDDDPEMTDLLQTVLSDAGYVVTAAANGAEALQEIDQHPPRLVVTDLSMPEMSGLDLVAAARLAHPDIPFIILTAFGDWPSFCRAQDLGVERYLSKPVALDELLQEVEQLAVGGREKGAGSEPEPEDRAKGRKPESC